MQNFYALLLKIELVMRWIGVLCRQTPGGCGWGNALSGSGWGGTLRCTAFGAVMIADVTLNQHQVCGDRELTSAMDSKGIIAEKTFNSHCRYKPYMSTICCM